MGAMSSSDRDSNNESCPKKKIKWLPAHAKLKQSN